MTHNSLPQAGNGNNPKGQQNGHEDPFNFCKKILEAARERKIARMVAYLELELDRSRRMLAEVRSEASPKNAALLAVGRATEATGDRFADADEVRQFGLTVAYSVIEAALNEQPTLPACFTADDLVIASDVLAGEMGRGWAQ